MKKENIKSSKESRTEHTQIVFSEYINGVGRLFGGKLVEWMDIVAAVVARRHSECEVTTVSIDKMDFALPAKLNDTILIIGEIVSVGNTSMNIKITAYVEKLGGDRVTISTANFIMVALGKEDIPCKVPRLAIS
ncbi:MAG: acyl-CoA thioesterase [Bacillota bacterium]